MNGKGESRFIDTCLLVRFCDVEEARGIIGRKFLLLVGPLPLLWVFCCMKLILFCLLENPWEGFACSR